mgnify:CR=1 FL=1
MMILHQTVANLKGRGTGPAGQVPGPLGRRVKFMVMMAAIMAYHSESEWNLISNMLQLMPGAGPAGQPPGKS